MVEETPPILAEDRLRAIRERWGATRNDFDWSLHGSAVRGEQAVKDIRHLLDQLTALTRAQDAAQQEIQRLQETVRGWDYTKGCIDEGLQKHAHVEFEDARKELAEINRQAWHAAVTLAVEKLHDRAEAAEQQLADRTRAQARLIALVDQWRKQTDYNRQEQDRARTSDEAARLGHRIDVRTRCANELEEALAAVSPNPQRLNT